MHRLSKTGLEQLGTVQKRAALKIIRGLPKMSGEAALPLAGMSPLTIKAKTRQDNFRTGEKEYLADSQKRWQLRLKEVGPN